MKFDPVLIPPRRAAMLASGLWRNETINHSMERALSTCPDKEAVVAYRVDRSEPTRLTYFELDRRADVAAANFARLGIGSGDVVSFQLPNWWEFIALALACAKTGAVANPIMSIFRERELTFMLNFGESKLLVVPKSYRGFDYEAMVDGMASALTTQPLVVVVDGDGENSFERVLQQSAPGTSLTPVQPDDVLLLMYTSGTTGEPKGVMHSSNTLFANLHGFIKRLELLPTDVVLGASPMAHLTGYGYLAMIPLVLNSTTVLQDVWDANRALEIVRDEHVTFSMASSVFVADMCDAIAAGAPVSPAFNKFCCAGAPIPPVIVERARELMGLTVCSAWGMTENGAVTITEPGRALMKSGVSDGRPVPGMEVKIVDGTGKAVPTGKTGSLLVRGASLFGGYLKRPELNATDSDGWFDTGDLAFLDPEGYIRIDGRTKDIIIRGGENIPVVEIENLLYQHPSVDVAAIVGYPDARMGEKCCAVVILKPDTTFTMSDMTTYLSASQVTRSYHPERLIIVDALPRTPSGKIQKFRLREIATEPT
jgi:cyclohexanecarboxylate-CoA ligase